MAFKAATKKQAKLRMGLMGPAGSGKTYTALQIATGLGGRIAALDSEHGSMSKYAGAKGPFAFDVDEDFEDYSIATYIGKIQAAAKAGYDVLIIDSLSHAWVGKGGALEQVDRLASAGKGNKFTDGWSKVTPQQTRLIETILAYPGHVILTLRTKTEYVLRDRNGKSAPEKVGLAPIQRDGIEYEMDVAVSLDLKGSLSVEKTRCPDLKDGVYAYEDVPRMVAKLKAWLDDGAPAPAAAPLAKGASDEETLQAAFKARAGRIGERVRKLGIEGERFKSWVTDTLGAFRPWSQWSADDMVRLEESLRAEEAVPEQSRGQPAGGEHLGAVV